ncbi:MAG: glycosyltransferase family 39 protein [Anaerolineae bacterium]|jgi:hypothetical protein
MTTPQPRPAPDRAPTERRIALALVACFVALGIIYSAMAPLLESPDEAEHYAYVKYLADGRGLPVQRPGEATHYRQEGSQPPLYYALGAALTAGIDSGDFEALLVRNPHARIGVGMTTDNQNTYLHSEAQAWPGRGAALAIHLLRLLSVAMGAGTVWGVYRLGQALWPQRPGVTLGAMALTAFNPMFIYVSASVNNDNAITLLSTWALVQLVRLLRDGCTWRRLLGLGLTVGLAPSAKVSGLALLPVAAAALLAAAARDELAAWWPDRRSRRLRLSRGALLAALRQFGVVLAMALLLSGWWYARNVALYGELTGVQTMLAVFGRRKDLFALGAALAEFRGFLLSYWGLLGTVNVVVRPVWALWALQGVLAAGWLGLGYLAATGRWREDAGPAPEQPAAARGYAARGYAARGYAARGYAARGYAARGYAALSVLLLALWIVALHLSLLRWTLLTRASQGRLVFPAIAAISLLTARGLAAWPTPGGGARIRGARIRGARIRGARIRGARIRGATIRWPQPLAVVSALLAALAISVPWATLRPAYAPPQALTRDEIPAAATRIDVTFGEAIALLAYELDRDTLAPGDEVTVTLYWQSLAPVDADYSMYLHLFGRAGAKIGQRDSHAGMGKHPTSRWRPGEVYRDRYALRVQAARGAAAVEAPVAAPLEVGLYDYATMKPLPRADAQGNPLGQVLLGRLKVAGAGLAAVRPQHPLDVTLDGDVRLLGYDLPATPAAPGEAVPLTLYWQTGPLGEDYQVFVHLVAADGALIGQGDGPPFNGDYPTRYWGAGERLADARSVAVDAAAAPGTAQLYVGLYSLRDGHRLRVLAPAAPDDRIALGALQIAPVGGD